MEKLKETEIRWQNDCFVFIVQKSDQDMDEWNQMKDRKEKGID